jgi:hypothetical protein
LVDKQEIMKGLGTALVTPFTEEGKIDFEALGTLIEYQIAGGTDYLVVLGTTSEVPTLSHKEQDEIVTFVVKQVAGRIPLVLGIGGNSTAAVVEKIEEGKDLADIFYEFHIRAVNITDEECIRYKISKEMANNIVTTIKTFANEIYNQKVNKTLFDIKKEFPVNAMKYNKKLNKGGNKI